jgi:hypothetical protein
LTFWNIWYHSNLDEQPDYNHRRAIASVCRFSSTFKFIF